MTFPDLDQRTEARSAAPAGRDLPPPGSGAHADDLKAALGSLAAGDISFPVERVVRAHLAELAMPWDDLARRAVEPNALLAPGFAIAALTHLADVQPFEVLAIWRQAGARRLLVGVVALRLTSRRWGIGLGLAEAMAHNYGPLGTPLFDRDHGHAAAEALVSWLRTTKIGRRFFLMPFLNEDGAAAHLLRDVMAKRGLRYTAFGRFHRALAAPAGPGRYVEATMPQKRRRELARLRRRLEESGSLRHTIATTPEAVEAAVEIFLTLEQSGWKGRAGTATTQRSDRRLFVTAAVNAMAAAGQARIHLIEHNQRPIAAGVAFVSQNRAWFWKVAYDETFAASSPGVQLTLELTDDLLGLPGIDSIDSLADAGHPMINHIWREHLTMAHWLIDLKPKGSLLFGLAIRLEELRGRVREGLVALRNRLRRRAG